TTVNRQLPSSTCTARITTQTLITTNPPTTEISTLSLHDALPILIGFRLVRMATLRTFQMSMTFRYPVLSQVQELNIKAVRAIALDRKSTRLNSSHVKISYAVFCLKKKKIEHYCKFGHRYEM